MSSTDILNLIILLLPFLLALAGLLYKLIELRLPANIRATLDQFVTIAVQMVEQKAASFSSGQKKQMAVQAVIDLFAAIHLPAPSVAIIGTAIESAVYELNQSKAQTLTAVDALAPATPKQPQAITLPDTMK